MTRPRIALTAAAAILSACGEDPQITHYVLALSWQPAFCESNADKAECLALDAADFAARHLTVHGLWPNDRPNAGPAHCGVAETIKKLDRPDLWCALPEPDLSPGTRARLAEAMPGTLSCLDRHEWIKHGTCAGTDAERYFGESLRLAAAVQATAFAQTVSDNVGREVTAERLMRAFEASFGAGSAQALTLVCTEGGDLSEIRIALRASALDGGLDGEDLYLDGPAPASRCPRSVHIDLAGP